MSGIIGGCVDYSPSLTKYLLAFVLGFFSSFTFAAGSVPKLGGYVCQQQAHAFGDSPSAACNKLAYQPTDASCGISIGLCADGYCSAIQYGHGYCTITYQWAYQQQSQCPPNATPNGDQCDCGGDTVPSDDQKACVEPPGSDDDPPDCKYGTSGTRNFTTGWSRSSAAASASGASDLGANEAAVAQAASFAGSQVCDGKCAMNVGAPSKAWHAETPAYNGMYRISADFNVEFLGGCSASQATTPGTRPNEIPPPCDGYVGQVNGETTCVKSAASRPDTKQNAGVPLLKGNPAASTSSDQASATRQTMPEGWGTDAGPGGPSGGPSSSNFGSPRGAGGLAPSGPGGGASSPGSGAPGSSDPGGSFCQENPTADICKPSTFAGACAGGFTCSGDAVSCAMAREQYNRNCAFYDIDTPLSMKGRDYVGNGATPTPPGHPGAAANIQNTTFSFATLIDTSSLGFSAQCPSDRTFAGAGSSFVIPFSELCGPMQVLGQVMVAICMLGAVAIVFRGGK